LQLLWATLPSASLIFWLQGDLLPERFQRYGTRTFIEALLLAYDVPSEDSDGTNDWWAA